MKSKVSVGSRYLTLVTGQKPTDPSVLSDTIDPMYSSIFSDTDGFTDDWFQQPTYFDPSLNSNNHNLSPLDNSMYAEPDILSAWRPDDPMFDSPRKDSVCSPNNPRTRSLYEDPDNPAMNTDSQPVTPVEPSLKHDSPRPQTPPKRKRGRPRLIRADSESSYDESVSRKPRLSRRQPHNEVERKYREGLNAELERLRMAIPTLPQWDSQLLHGPPKPSKATVLASAIDYIHKMELECDRLQGENEILRAGRGMVTGQGTEVNGRLKGYAWPRPQVAISLR